DRATRPRGPLLGVVARSALGRVRHERRPRVRRDGEPGAGDVLGVTDVDGAGGEGELDAGLAVVATAVAALEPRQLGRVPGSGLAEHVSPSRCSMKASDSRGESAWALIVPYCSSRMHSCFGSVVCRPLNSPSARPTAVPSANFSSSMVPSVPEWVSQFVGIT